VHSTSSVVESTATTIISFVALPADGFKRRIDIHANEMAFRWTVVASTSR
jgi:hypothetical protein